MSPLLLGGATRIAVEGRLRRELEETRIRWQRAIEDWKELTLNPASGGAEVAAIELARLNPLTVDGNTIRVSGGGVSLMPYTIGFAGGSI